MSPEGVRPSFDKNIFLLNFFEKDFVNPIPKWQEFETSTALWRVVATTEGNKVIVAVRISDIGDIDSFCIDLDNPDDFAHVSLDAQEPFFSEIEGVQAQIEMGLEVPNAEELDLFDELIDRLRLQEALG